MITRGYFGTPLQWVCAALGAAEGVFFGDWLARKKGLNPDGGFWTWRYYAYCAFRAAVIVDGAVLGYVAGTELLNICKTYLLSNPKIMAKMPGVVLWLLGIGSSKGLTPSTVANLIVSAKRVGSALNKSDTYHRAASWLTQSQLAKGSVYYINNGKRILLQVKGELNGKKGIFEYIIDEAGNVCHQLFKPGGLINGKPN